MRFGMGAQLLSYPRASRSGVGSYIRLLIDHLPDALGEHHLHVFAPEAGAVPSRPGVHGHPAPFPVDRRVLRLPYEQLVLPVAARRARVDVFHHPDPLAPLGMRPARRTVVTVHDMTAFRFPETFGPSRSRYKQGVLARAVARAHRIVVDSDATGRDLVEILDVDPGRMTTAHLGVDTGLWYPAESDDARDGAPYVLSVGTLEPRKNLGRLIDAFALARRRGLEARLVIVGPTGWKSGSLGADLDRHALGDAVEFAGYVPVERLRGLYGGAAAVVYPSLYEGFGLPVLEAMACGAPVIASSTPAVAETAGSAAVLVDPTDTDSIAAAIEEVTGDEERQRRLSEAGLARAATFHWSETARLTVEAYLDAASS